MLTDCLSETPPAPWEEFGGVLLAGASKAPVYNSSHDLVGGDVSGGVAPLPLQLLPALGGDGLVKVTLTSAKAASLTHPAARPMNLRSPMEANR